MMKVDIEAGILLRQKDKTNVIASGPPISMTESSRLSIRQYKEIKESEEGTERGSHHVKSSLEVAASKAAGHIRNNPLLPNRELSILENN